MKINRNKLFQYLKFNCLSVEEFSKDLGWSFSKAMDILFANGELNRDEAEKFINTIGASCALEIINWRAMNVRKPQYCKIFQTRNAY